MIQKKNPKFLEKLYNILENHLCKALRWNSKGDAFEIHDIERVEEQVLSVHYKQGSFSSFIRQLNLYGFQRFRPKKGVNVFKHQFFVRGKKNDLIKIVSSNRLKSYQQMQSQDGNLKQQAYESEHNNLAETLQQLQNQQKQIQFQFKEQIQMQCQVKQRIINIINSIYKFDQILNQLAFNTQVLLLKAVEVLPNDERHQVEINFLKDICRALSELHYDSLSSYRGSPFSNKFTPIPFHDQQIEQQKQQNQLIAQITAQFYQTIIDLYAPYIKHQILNR